MGGDPGHKALAAVPGQELRKAADAVEGPVGGQALLVQGLHGQIGVNQKILLLLAVQLQHLGHTPDKGAVKNAVVIGAGRGIVLNDPDLAQLLRLLQEFCDLALILHVQSHPELLQGGFRVLDIDVGNVEVEIVDQLQYLGSAAGLVPEGKLQKHHGAFIAGILQVADALQLDIRLAQLLGGAFHIQKEHMSINSLVVADTGDIDTQTGKASAGFQKCADVIRQGSGIGLLHGILLAAPQKCMIFHQFTIKPGQKQEPVGG